MSEPDYRTPGQLLKDLLDQKGWSQAILAAVLDVDKTVINKMITGKRSVDATMALVLSEVFGEEPERFMELQLSFDLAQAKITMRPDPMRATRAQLLSDFPVQDMIQRGWLDARDMKSLPAIESSLAKFFESETAAGIESLPHAAKKTNVAEDVSPVQLAWIYRVRKIAREMIVAPYSKKKGQAALGQLSSLLQSPEEARHVPRLLAESGIRFVIVEELKGSKIDGVCFWLDDKSPVIGMSLRFDRIDNFWFVLRHEIEHVLQEDGKVLIALDSDLEGEAGGVGDGIPEFERNANAAAAAFCVPQDALDRFIKRKSPLFAERDLIGFSKTQSLHPGLVAGQLQRVTGRYELFRKHLVPVKKHVAPSALVDGWGDVVPLNS